MCRFLPKDCEMCFKVLDPEVDAEAIRDRAKLGDKGKNSHQLDMVTWQMAWDRYALAAAMVKMLKFIDAGRYKQVSLACCSGVCI